LPVSYDNLSNGHQDAVKWGPLITADLLDQSALAAAFTAYKPRAVMHFAGLIEAGLSVREPARFERQNVAGSAALLAAMQAHQVNKLVFSSSAAVYGAPQQVRITEDHPRQPANPYGQNKADIEDLLTVASKQHALRFCALRYFNAAGADPDGELGERHDPETHLIPLVIQAAFGHRPLAIYGTDYETVDGTCVRDYVHVSDLADAHVAAVQRLLAGGPNLAANLGSGDGYSVQQIIAATERLTGQTINPLHAARRQGDVAYLVANSALAEASLAWQATRSSLDQIISDAIAAQKRFVIQPQ
jgi:UDP-glucose-4-epimerase GalE